MGNIHVRLLGRFNARDLVVKARAAGTPFQKLGLFFLEEIISQVLARPHGAVAISIAYFSKTVL